MNQYVFEIEEPLIKVFREHHSVVGLDALKVLWIEPENICRSQIAGNFSQVQIVWCDDDGLVFAQGIPAAVQRNLLIRRQPRFINWDNNRNACRGSSIGLSHLSNRSPYGYLPEIFFNITRNFQNGLLSIDKILDSNLATSSFRGCINA